MLQHMNTAVTRQSVLDRVRALPEDLLEEADLRLAELFPIGDEAWLEVLKSAPGDDEPLTLKELRALDPEKEERVARRKDQPHERKAI